MYEIWCNMGRNVGRNVGRNWKKTCLGYLKMMKQVKTNIGKSYRANMCANNENKETRWEKTSLGECMNTCFVREMEPWKLESLALHSLFLYLLVVSTLLNNTSQLGLFFPKYGKIKFLSQTTNQYTIIYHLSIITSQKVLVHSSQGMWIHMGTTWANVDPACPRLCFLV